MQECYNIYRTAYIELTKHHVEVSESYLVGPLLSRRIIFVIWQAEQKMETLHKYDAMGAD